MDHRIERGKPALGGKEKAAQPYLGLLVFYYAKGRQNYSSGTDLDHSKVVIHQISRDKLQRTSINYKE